MARPSTPRTLGSHDFTVTGTDDVGNETVVTNTYTVLDVTAPTVTITSPEDNATFDQNESVLADYACADEPGGSGIDTCVGNVADGAAIDTSTLGDIDFTVTATDNDGNVTEVTHTYTVEDVTDPAVTITTPADGATFDRGELVAADYACEDEASGSGLLLCFGTVPDGVAIATSTLGAHTFQVFAIDAAGNLTAVLHSYTVVDGTDPSVTIDSPQDGATYEVGESVSADYSCEDEVGGSGLDSCVGTVANGAAIDTSTLGAHDFTVTATDNAGNETEVTNAYTVVDETDPEITITTPVDGAVFEIGESVTVDFACTDVSGVDSCVGPLGRWRHPRHVDARGLPVHGRRRGQRRQHRDADPRLHGAGGRRSDGRDHLTGGRRGLRPGSARDRGLRLRGRGRRFRHRLLRGSDR